MNLPITVGICTRNRYHTTLPLTLMSIANQTCPPSQCIIYDDSDEPKDMREIEVLNYIFGVFHEKEIDLSVIYGRKMGQHWGHKVIQERTKNPFIFRVDDDCIADPHALSQLYATITSFEAGAVGGLVLPPSAPKKEVPSNLISNINDNCQWYRWAGMDALKLDNEHLYGGAYLYRKGIQNFETNLSRKAFREETLHTYGIFKKGHKLIIDSTALVYHFQNSQGGIRTEKEDEENKFMFWQDDLLFQSTLREYGYNCQKEKNFVIDEGMGDHVVFAALIPEIKDKYKDFKLNFYVCFPELFKKYGVDTYSIERAKNTVGHIQRFNLYEFMVKSGRKDNLREAYRKLYGLDKINE